MYADTVVPEALSDEGREELIAEYARLMQEAMEHAHGEFRLVWLGHAHRARHRMEALIAGRSSDKVRSLELARGLV